MSEANEGGRRKEGVTLAAVARRAGVSAMTVSRVLNEPEKVSEAVRRRVEEAVRACGYVRNNLAGGLVSARTGIVAVLAPSLSNAVFDVMLAGLSTELENEGRQILIANTGYSSAAEAAIVRRLLGWRPEGIVLTGVDHEPELRDLLAGTPVVEVMDLTDDPIDAVVGFRHDLAARDLVATLIGRGYRSIAYVGAQYGRDFRTRRRHEGFLRAHREAGLAPGAEICLAEHSSFALGAWAMEKLLEWRPETDAVFFTNDDMACGAVMHCHARGVPVPGRIAVAGFNGLDVGRALHPMLTTVDTPRGEVGRCAARLLLDRIAGRRPEPIVDLGYRVVVGGTV